MKRPAEVLLMMGIENLLKQKMILWSREFFACPHISQLFLPIYKDVLVPVKLKANAVNASEINAKFKPCG